jgi:hypothetical protein
MAVVACWLLAACAGRNDVTARDFLARFDDRDPTIHRIAVCHGFGCAVHDEISLADDWREIVALFAGDGDAVAERLRIAEAVALFERAAAGSTPVGADRAGTFGVWGEPGQLDCVDEAANTSRLLVLLDGAGLLRRHRAGPPATRGGFVRGWPHTTATIVERQTGTAFAVDSWLHPNGDPPEVVPLDQWLAGWKPDASGGAEAP